MIRAFSRKRSDESSSHRESGSQGERRPRNPATALWGIDNVTRIFLAQNSGDCWRLERVVFLSNFTCIEVQGKTCFHAFGELGEEPRGGGLRCWWWCSRRGEALCGRSKWLMRQLKEVLDETGGYSVHPTEMMIPETLNLTLSRARHVAERASASFV